MCDSGLGCRSIAQSFLVPLEDSGDRVGTAFTPGSQPHSWFPATPQQQPKARTGGGHPKGKAGGLGTPGQRQQVSSRCTVVGVLKVGTTVLTELGGGAGRPAEKERSYGVGEGGAWSSAVGTWRSRAAHLMPSF